MKLAIRFGRSKRLAVVQSLAHASAVWAKIRDEQNLSSSNSPKVSVVDVDSLRVVASISYNGRIWDTAGKELCEVKRLQEELAEAKMANENPLWRQPIGGA